MHRRRIPPLQIVPAMRKFNTFWAVILIPFCIGALVTQIWVGVLAWDKTAPWYNRVPGILQVCGVHGGPTAPSHSLTLSLTFFLSLSLSLFLSFFLSVLLIRSISCKLRTTNGATVTIELDCHDK